MLTTLRHFRHEFEDHIRAKRCRAGVCQDLALSPCENSCPLHMNIPRFLQLYKEGRLEDAFESVIMDNPLPASTGRVCQHPCDSRCRRQAMDEPVNMREVHRFIADSILLSDRFDADGGQDCRQAASGHRAQRIAVVGAGPAGLTASFYLALLGHEVTVYESNAEPGGMLRFALPEYRLPRNVLDREIEIIRRLGVKFVLNSRIGADIALNDLEDKFDAVFLSLGTWKESQVLSARQRSGGRIPARCISWKAWRTTERTDLGDAGRHHRRRQRRHRLRAHGAAQGLVRDRHLPARTQGHAGDRGRSRCGRGRGRELPVPGLPASHCRRARRTSRPSKSPRHGWASSTPRAADARSTPARCRPSVATLLSWRWAKASTANSARRPAWPPSQAARSTLIATT